MEEIRKTLKTKAKNEIPNFQRGKDQSSFEYKLSWYPKKDEKALSTMNDVQQLNVNSPYQEKKGKYVSKSRRITRKDKWDTFLRSSVKPQENL